MPRVRRCRYPNCHAMVVMPHWYCAKHIGYEAEYLAKRERYRMHSSHTQREVHQYNTVTRNRNETKQTQYEFYRTKQWVSLRQTVLERDHYLCQYCLVNHRVTPAKTVDHIVPIEYDSKLKANVDNLAVICNQCHHAKTKWEQEYYGTGQDHKIKNVNEVFDLRKIVENME